jgi:hypothetical protein
MTPWARHLYACDGAWWRVHLDAVLATFTGKLWTQDKGYQEDARFNYVESRPGSGLAEDALIQGDNSGYQAINLAKIRMNADIVLLLGYDMQGRGTHWFGRHDGSKGLSTSTNYGDLCGHFNKMHPERYGLQVLNMTRTTALECFPRITLEEAVRRYGRNKVQG